MTPRDTVIRVRANRAEEEETNGPMGMRGTCETRLRVLTLVMSRKSSPARLGLSILMGGVLVGIEPGEVRRTADPSTARRDRSASLGMTKERATVP
jgi:hypothetical protein